MEFYLNKECFMCILRLPRGFIPLVLCSLSHLKKKKEDKKSKIIVLISFLLLLLLFICYNQNHPRKREPVWRDSD